MPALDYDRFDVLTFDCYGTLIDWDTGIEPRCARRCRSSQTSARATCSPRYAAQEADRGRALPPLPRGAEPRPPAGSPPPTASRSRRGGRVGRASVGDWPAFPDSVEALARLKERFRLGVITNCDDDLFAASHVRLAGSSTG